MAGNPYTPGSEWIQGTITIGKDGRGYYAAQHLDIFMSYLPGDKGDAPWRFEVADHSLVVTNRKGEMWRLMNDGGLNPGRERFWSRVWVGSSEDAPNETPPPRGLIAKWLKGIGPNSVTREEAQASQPDTK